MCLGVDLGDLPGEQIGRKSYGVEWLSITKFTAGNWAKVLFQTPLW